MKDILIGFAAGCVLAILLLLIQAVKAHAKVVSLRKERDKYKQIVADRMDVESEGLAKLKQENEELKKQNENLRITVGTYSQKPGRKEIARLQVYQLAVERLTLNSPGFGSAWQAALKESEDEFQKTYIGVQPFLRKLIPTKASDAEVISIDDGDEAGKKQS